MYEDIKAAQINSWMKENYCLEQDIDVMRYQ